MGSGLAIPGNGHRPRYVPGEIGAPRIPHAYLDFNNAFLDRRMVCRYTTADPG